MSRQEVLALPVQFDLLTAAKALDISRSFAYELARRDDFLIRVERRGRRYWCKRSDLLTYLGIAEDARV